MFALEERDPRRLIDMMHDIIMHCHVSAPCSAPPAGAAAAVCSPAGDQSSPGRAAGGCPGPLFLLKGAGEGQSSVSSEDHGRRSGGWRMYDFVFVSSLVSVFVFFTCIWMFLYFSECNCTVQYVCVLVFFVQMFSCAGSVYMYYVIYKEIIDIP